MQYGNLVPFGIADAGRYVGSGPPVLTSGDPATGPRMGRGVGRGILSTRLLYTTGPTHHGPCPL